MNHKNNYRSIIVLFFFFLASCQSQMDLIDIIKMSKCEAPCWLEMTPGKTTIEDARRQLSINEEIISQNSVFDYAPTTLFPVAIGWKGIDENLDGTLYFRDGFLHAININEKNGNGRLEEFIEVYGEPDKIVCQLQGGDSIHIRVFLFYSQKGVIISFKQNNLNRIEIQNNEPIDKVVFFNSKDINFPDTIFVSDKIFELPWTGFTTLEITDW